MPLKILAGMNNRKRISSILVIDDDPIHNYLIDRLLYCCDVNDITYRQNGLTAINFLKERISTGKKLPDLIICDVYMPIMDGFGFLSELDTLGLTGITLPRVILISASAQLHHFASEYFEVDKEIVAKPVNREKILPLLEKYDLILEEVNNYK